MSDLDTFRNDVYKIITEIGVEVVYAQVIETTDDVGQLSTKTTNTINTKVIIDSGDESNRTNTNLGEHTTGNQRINIPYRIYEFINGAFNFNSTFYVPKVNDLITIKNTNIVFKINRIEREYVFNGLVDNNCTVERVTLNEDNY